MITQFLSAALLAVSLNTAPKMAANDSPINLPDNWSIIGYAGSHIKFDGNYDFNVADGATEYIPNTATSVSVDWGLDNNNEPFVTIAFSNIGTENFSVRIDDLIDYQYSRVENVNGGFSINFGLQDAESFVVDERDFTAWLQIIATDYPTEQFYGTYSGGFTQSVNLVDYDHLHNGYSLAADGSLSSASNSFVTSFIPVKPNTAYAKDGFGASWGAQYDEHGNFLRLASMETTFTTPQDCYFVRFNGNVSYTHPTLVVGSSLPSSYLPYNASWSLTSPYTNFHTPVYFDDNEMGYVGFNRFEDNYFIASFAYIEFKGFNNQDEMSQFIDDIGIALSEGTTSNMSYEGNSEGDYELGFVIDDQAQSATFSFTIGHANDVSVSFLLRHCTTATPYPVVLRRGIAFSATFTAMQGYAFVADHVAEYFDYPQGALTIIYRVSDYVGDFGSYWRSVTITATAWADCTLTIAPAPLDEGALQTAYDNGYNDAKTIYQNTNQFSWLKSIWSGMASFFSIEILPNISLGFLAFAPLLVVAIVAIVRILKHD